MTTAIMLAVAGFRVEIVCPTGRFAEAVAARYEPWLTGGTAHGRVVVNLAAAHTSAPADSGVPNVSFEPDEVMLEHPAWTGGVALDGRESWLRSTPAAAGAGLEYVLRTVMAQVAIAAGGMLLHAAGLVREGRAYVFTGPSGTGKTTVARLSTDAIVLNDDLVLLLPAGGDWFAHSTPFTGPDQVPPAAGPVSAPLAAVLRLVQAPEVALEPVSGGQALAEVFAAMPAPAPGNLSLLLGHARALSQAVPVARLHFRRDATFWDMAMSQEKAPAVPKLAPCLAM